MKLTDQQGQRLTTMMLAMRPDWTPNKPGIVLTRANETTGFPAADFNHCIRALAAYATETNPDGTFAKRTPNLYPEHGRHWTSTAPAEHELPNPKPCEDHETEPAHNCRSCRADVLVGERPETMIGKQLTAGGTPGRSPRPDSTRPHPKEATKLHQPSGGDPTPENEACGAIPQCTTRSPANVAKNPNGGTL